MAITLEQWKNMKPGKVKIVDANGDEWQVIEKLENEKHPSFNLRLGRYQPAKFMFVPNAIHEEPGIVDKAWTWSYALNLSETNIVSVED